MDKKVNNNKNYSTMSDGDDSNFLAVIRKLTGKETSRIDLYKKALTHKSADLENNYEALEFLGDRVIGLIIAEFIFKLNWGKGILNVGDIHNSFASFTNETAQAVYFNKLKLSSFIHYEQGATKPSNKTNADFIEAFIGAVYSDCGITRAVRVMNKIALNDVRKYKSYSFISPKELEVRKLIKKRTKEEFLIEYTKIGKDWELKVKVKKRSYSTRDPNLTKAREDLINILYKIYK